MEFEDERYVRVFTRDTITWKMLGWEGRCFLLNLFRKVDRAGTLDMEAGIEGLAVLLDMPEAVVKTGLASCKRRDTVVVDGLRLIVPNFLRAQECKQTDAQRQRESRARRRDLRDQGVTLSDDLSRNVTDPSRIVTSRVTSGRNVTPSLPSRTCTNSAILSPVEPIARAACCRFRDSSKDHNAIARVMIGSKPTSTPSAPLVELFRKALARHPCTQEELDAMAVAVGRGEMWGQVTVLPMARLAQLPDLTHQDHFGDLLGYVRTPDRQIPPALPIARRKPPARATGQTLVPAGKTWKGASQRKPGPKALKFVAGAKRQAARQATAEAAAPRVAADRQLGLLDRIPTRHS